MRSYLTVACILFSSLICPRAGNAQGINPNTSLQTEIINDPSLGNRKAFTVTIPSGWKFQGTVIAAVGCNLPSPVFRAYSPDGLTEIRLLPSFNWQFQEKNASGQEGLDVGHECIYLNDSMTAAQFLDRYVQTLGPAHVVGPMSISTQYRQQLDELVAKMNAIKLQDLKWSMHTTGDAAALRIETINGTFTTEQRLRARVVCSLWSKAIAGKAGNCSVRLDVLRAPKGQLHALVNLVDSHNLTNAKNDDEWLSMIVAQIRDQGKHFDPYIPNRAAVRMLYLQAHDFGLSDEERRRLIEEWNEPVVRPMHQAEMVTLSPSNGTSDWADFALDPTPTTDGQGVVHLPDTMHAWSSSSGQRYQTDNPDANPNGVFGGSWTEETKSVATKPQ
ncbi:MAG: hypothetical protein WA708_07290 [Acidobacteriaceae bacterium]